MVVLIVDVLGSGSHRRRVGESHGPTVVFKESASNSRRGFSDIVAQLLHLLYYFHQWNCTLEGLAGAYVLRLAGAQSNLGSGVGSSTG